jgi:hypothetical protein
MKVHKIFCVLHQRINRTLRSLYYLIDGDAFHGSIESFNSKKSIEKKTIPSTTLHIPCMFYLWFSIQIHVEEEMNIPRLYYIFLYMNRMKIWPLLFLFLKHISISTSHRGHWSTKTWIQKAISVLPASDSSYKEPWWEKYYLEVIFYDVQLPILLGTTL